MKLEECSPSLTTLAWLRTKEGKVGTKEGCGTGDCGACTILVGEERDDSFGKRYWYYRTMNSCLMLIGNAHGKHIITVEAVTQDIHPALDALHPVQQAMVESHGSQCGFCTPGIIMSLIALYINNESYPGTKAVIEALGGNLCRCTGYRPILAAAEKAYEYTRVQEPWSALAREFKQHSAFIFSGNTCAFLQQDGRRFYLPQSILEVVALKEKYPKGYLVAGATDCSIELNQRHLKPKIVISVNQVTELMQLADTSAQFEIGAAVPYCDFIEPLCETYPEAKELFERLGSMQVRNAGTLGGSLGNASAIGDPAPLLIALNASLELQSANGVRTVKVEDFFLKYRQTVMAPTELISKIIIPKRSANLKLACHKISKRIEDDISSVCLVLAIEHSSNVITSARCAFGGMSAVPARAKQLEEQLIGSNITVESFIKAGQVVDKDFSPMTDVRASAEYRLAVSKNLLQRIAIEFSQPSITSSLVDSQPTRISHASL